MKQTNKARPLVTYITKDGGSIMCDFPTMKRLMRVDDELTSTKLQKDLDNATTLVGILTVALLLCVTKITGWW